MAEAIAFDTHRFVKHLTQKGFTQEQAEALAEEQVNLLNGNLATKADLKDLEVRLTRMIYALGFGLAITFFGVVINILLTILD